MNLHRDASDRLFASFDADASSYGRLVARVIDEFRLEARGSRTEGLEEIFQDFARGEHEANYKAEEGFFEKLRAAFR